MRQNEGQVAKDKSTNRQQTPDEAWIDVDGLEWVKGHHFTAGSQMEISRRYAVALMALLP